MWYNILERMVFIMKFTICDDTLSDLNNLEAILQSYALKNNFSIEIEKHSDPNELIKRVDFSALDYQIFFLDVVMPKNGIETAKRIRNICENAIIVFTTSSKEFAIDAFSVRAYDYLLKPLEENKVFECIDRLINELKSSPKTVCKIKTNDLTITSINIKEIAYIESINRRIKFYMKNGDIITSTTLHSKFLESIPFDYEKFGFINCHASYVVNLNYIKSITEKCFYLKNDEIIPISKSMLQVVKKRYINYLVGE